MAYTARMRQIVPGLLLGNVWWNSSTRNAGIPERRHKWIQCVDSSTQDLLSHMSDICNLIDEMASPALSSLSFLCAEHGHQANDEPNYGPPQNVLVHCDIGISRPPTVIIAYLMRKLAMKQADVLEYVQSKQKVQPSANPKRQLVVWEETGYEVWEDEDKTVPKALYKAFLEHRAAVLKSKGLAGDEPLAPVSLVWWDRGLVELPNSAMIKICCRLGGASWDGYEAE
ncbi:hypothetical protein N8T08_003935 [Aspergillus melleus]|uniref:Uncharacterized protein n=1 Tax=Aspergillus melleus TaxID=138277 RepID=A0ACC3B6S1_9EURO|nr:hypothetical protein N8T08_003935 [Aspergillus melleus]